MIDKSHKLDALATPGSDCQVRRLELVPTRPAREALREPLRLLFVGTLTEPGGAASHFVSLAKAMTSAGHSVSVVATPGSGIWRALEHARQITLYGAAFTRTFESSALQVLRQAVREQRPHRLISVFERDYLGTALVAAQCRVPLDLFLHHAGLKRSSRLVLPWLRRRFLLPSESLRRWIVARGVSDHRAQVLYNPIDTSHFRPQALLRESTRAALGLTNDDVLIGFVGRLESNKGILPFAKALTLAMSRVPRLNALWVGFGRREQELDALIQNSPYAKRHVRRGWIDDPLAYYAAMDILALPSTGPEAFGRVLVEAQSCGLPVLGSNIGGIAETMKVGVSGRLLNPGDVEAWSEAIVSLALDPISRSRMGAAGRKFAQSEFDSDVIAAAFEDLLQSAT